MANENVLAHYGVLGMKWGRRKDGKPQGFQYGKKGTIARTRASADFKESRRLKQNPKSTLTNQELQTVINRMNLEVQYSKLNPTKMQAAHNKVKNIMAVVGTVGSIIALHNSPMGQIIKKRFAK